MKAKRRPILDFTESLSLVELSTLISSIEQQFGVKSKYVVDEVPIKKKKPFVKVKDRYANTNYRRQ